MGCRSRFLRSKYNGVTLVDRGGGDDDDDDVDEEEKRRRI